MFIIDLDDTLLDTQSFKQARISALAPIGVSEDQYKKSYTQAYANVTGANIYNDTAHAKVLAEYGFAEEVIQKRLEDTTAKLKTFLFPDTIDFLEFLQAKKQLLVLLSLGEKQFQENKIQHIEIGLYFNEIFTVDSTKEVILGKIIEKYKHESQFWFINDKPKETVRAVSMFPQLQPVLKISPIFTEDEYSVTRLPYFKTLTEIKQYVEQQIA